MSVLLVNKVKLLLLPFGPKSILHWLADESRDSETVSFGIDYLANLAGCSARTAQNHIRYLEDKGILIPTPYLVGRGKYPVYKINLDVIIMPRPTGKPRGLRKPPTLQKTDEEPPRSPIPMPPAPPDAPRPGGDIIPVEELRERRQQLLDMIARVERGERYALDYWQRYGQARLDELAAINHALGLDAQMIEEMEVPV